MLAKVKGRWKLTPLGVQLNQRTRLFLEDQAALFSGVDSTKGKTSPTVPEDCVLIVINAQNALFDASGIGRNNSEAEQNISLILDRWRSRNRRVVHVKHVSDRPGSMFFRNSNGCDFLDIAQPIKGELVIEKLKFGHRRRAYFHLGHGCNVAERSGLRVAGGTKNAVRNRPYGIFVALITALTGL